MRSLGCEVAIDLEGVEVAIVDTDDGAFDVESAFDLARVVALDERREAELARRLRELGELDRRQAPHDEKQRTRSDDTPLRVLARDRRRNPS